MREETRKRLNRLSQLEISAWFPALAIVIVVFMGLFAFRTTVRAEREVSGVVQRAVWRINDDTGQRYPDIHVILDNDALVRVGSVAPSLPDIGDRVKLRKRKMLIGYTTYEWDGPGSHKPPSLPPAATPVSLP
jgi:hypothetical protein